MEENKREEDCHFLLITIKSCNNKEVGVIREENLALNNYGTDKQGRYISVSMELIN